MRDDVTIDFNPGKMVEILQLLTIMHIYPIL